MAKLRGVARQMELLYLSTAKWHYEREDVRRARGFAVRLERLVNDRTLVKKRSMTSTVLGNEILALVAEALGQWKVAARHRRKKLALLQSLRRMSRDNPTVPPDAVAPPRYMAGCWLDLADAREQVGDRTGARTARASAARWARKARGRRFDDGPPFNDRSRHRRRRRSP